jgi:hypothetical protein
MNREANVRALLFTAISAAIIVVSMSVGSFEAEAAACVRGARGAACAGPRGAVVVPRRPVVVAPVSVHPPGVRAPLYVAPVNMW